MSKEDKLTLHKKDTIYHARILPQIGVYDLCELKVRTIEKDWFAATEKSTKKAFIFPYSAINKTIFFNRKEALEKVRNAELNREVIYTETDYEED